MVAFLLWQRTLLSSLLPVRTIFLLEQKVNWNCVRRFRAGEGCGRFKHYFPAGVIGPAVVVNGLGMSAQFSK